MAERVRLDTGIGMLGDIPDIQLYKGQLTEETALLISTRVRELVRKVNREISLGDGVDGYRAGNLDGQYINVSTTPAVADTEFIVVHGLKRVPIGYIVVRADKACQLYDSAVGSWTDSVLYLKCNVASATVKLLVW